MGLGQKERKHGPFCRGVFRQTQNVPKKHPSAFTSKLRNWARASDFVQSFIRDDLWPPHSQNASQMPSVEGIQTLFHALCETQSGNVVRQNGHHKSIVHPKPGPQRGQRPSGPQFHMLVVGSRRPLQAMFQLCLVPEKRTQNLGGFPLVFVVQLWTKTATT